MRTLLPRSLAGRLALLLTLAVALAQVTASLVFMGETTRVGRAAARTQVIDRIATLVQILDTAPQDAVPGVIAAFDSPRHRFSLDAASTIADNAMGSDEARLAHGLVRRLQTEASQARLLLVERGLGRDDLAGPRKAMPEALRVSVHLGDGRWLNGEAPLALPASPWIRVTLLQLAASVAAVLTVVALAMRGIVGPVAALAHAAEQLGRGETILLLPERGPRELQTMTRAFNLMQARLRAFVVDRTHMLAAISHDLRTPIASLWLRAEMVEDADLRGAMVRTLGEMKRMVEATLTFARDDAAPQDNGPFDLAAMARGLVDEQCALGRDASFRGPASISFHGRPLALKRALGNLVENAVRYGERARVSLDRTEDCVRIRVEDDGPGVPPDQVAQVFEPFARLEGSRSEETGGIGLGLSIARSAIRAHGGEIRLTNMPDRGLRAEIILPTVVAQATENNPGSTTIGRERPIGDWPSKAGYEHLFRGVGVGAGSKTRPYVGNAIFAIVCSADVFAGDAGL